MCSSFIGNFLPLAIIITPEKEYLCFHMGLMHVCLECQPGDSFLLLFTVQMVWEVGTEFIMGLKGVSAVVASFP